MPIEIRPYNKKDYQQIAAVLADAKPYARVSAEILQYRDQTRPSFCQSQRLVAVKDHHVIGFSWYTQYADMFEPHAYWIDVCVSRSHQRQGIGSDLYEGLLQSLQSKQPFTLRAQIQEDQPAGIQFAGTRGFQEFGRRWESRLDVTSFDKNRFSDIHANLNAQNIQIVSFNDLAADPQRNQKLYYLQTELDQDVPMPVPASAMTFEQFSAQILDNPSLVAEGFLVAMHGNEYIGMSSFFESGDGFLAIDLTGTRRAYRQRGIATALKIHGILFAQRMGYKTIIVQNDIVNQGMIAINEKLGFVRCPAIIQFAKEFK
jgi:mycothiol synthase